MYYIIEHDIRPDGVVNTSEVGRSDFAIAQSYYYDRYSKMLVTTQFASVHLMLTDEKLTVIMQSDIPTKYESSEEV